MTDEQSLPETLRTELLKLAKEGDKQKEGALTPEVLMRIMRVAKTGRDLLMSLDVSPKNLAALVKRPHSAFNSIGMMEDEGLGMDSLQSALPYAPSSPSENFGMTAIREIITATKNMNGGGTSPVKLVEALAIAREKGLDDVAQELEKQLGVGKEKPIIEAAKIVEKEEPKS